MFILHNTALALLTDASIYYHSVKQHDIATHIVDTFEIECKDNSRTSIYDAVDKMSDTQLTHYAEDLKELFNEYDALGDEEK